MAELDRDTCRSLWQIMNRIRAFDLRVSALAASGQIPGYAHTYSGEEAVACGVIPLLRPDDWITSTYRNHGHSIARGVSLEQLAAELMGRATGVCHGVGGSMHSVDQSLRMIGGMGIVAGGLPLAVGAAWGASLQGRDEIAVGFFGDGAVHQGTWHEAVDFAALFRVPVLFVCENNLYAETTATSYHLRTETVAEMMGPYGVQAQTVDGMDVMAVREATAAAISEVRHHRRPFLLEALTYRYGGQYEGDTQTYKPPSEVEYWLARDPLPAFRTRAEEAGWLGARELEEIAAGATAEVEAAFRTADAAPWPEAGSVWTTVYTTYATEVK